MDRSARERTLLQTHRVLLRAGLSLVSSFAWVFVFSYVLGITGNFGSAFGVALLVFAISQLILAFATPISASHLRGGVKRSAIFGACLAALAFAILGATLAGYFDSPLGWGLVLFGIVLGAYRALYWIPYRLQAAHAGSVRYALFEILIALMPAFGGLTLATIFLSSLRLLFGAATLMLLSIVPILFMRDIREGFSWGYVETFRKLFDERYQVLASRSVLSGVESTALFVIWPISVFLIVGRSYLIFGIVMSASLLVLLAARGLYKTFVRSRFPDGSMALDVAFSMSGWLLRLAAGTPIAIVFADSYSYVSAPSGTPDVVAREHHSDSGSYLDEFTAMQEIAMAFGRILMCIVVGMLMVLLPLSLALAGSLIIAAFAAGASSVLAYTAKAEAY